MQLVAVKQCAQVELVRHAQQAIVAVRDRQLRMLAVQQEPLAGLRDVGVPVVALPVLQGSIPCFSQAATCFAAGPTLDSQHPA